MQDSMGRKFGTNYRSMSDYSGTYAVSLHYIVEYYAQKLRIAATAS